VYIFFKKKKLISLGEKRYITSMMILIMEIIPLLQHDMRQKQSDIIHQTTHQKWHVAL
jgi:hypothetical protein